MEEDTARRELKDECAGNGDRAQSSSSSSSTKPFDFRHILPPHRLGRCHDSLESFRKAVAREKRTSKNSTPTTWTTSKGGPTRHYDCATTLPVGSTSSPPRMGKENKGQVHPAAEGSCHVDSNAPWCLSSRRKEYSLIVVTTHDIRHVLLGLKHRGFGTGLYNSFGGKVEDGEPIEEAARRELHEETGIRVDLEHVKKSHLGTLSFTFEDSPTEMIVHLFHVRIRLRTEKGDGVGSKYRESHKDEDGSSDIALLVDADEIRGCDEITPRWFDTDDIPLNNMFADDSVWLTRLLELRRWQQQQQQQQQQQDDARRGSLDGTPVPLLDGWFHFAPGGADANTVLHYHLSLRMSCHERVG